MRLYRSAAFFRARSSGLCRFQSGSVSLKEVDPTCKYHKSLRRPARKGHQWGRNCAGFESGAGESSPMVTVTVAVNIMSHADS